MARFFQPSKKIRELSSNNDKRRLTGVLVTGKATQPVRHKQQLCYLICIQEIDNGTEFCIVKRNCKVDLPPLTTFESETPQAAAAPAVPVPNSTREQQSLHIVTTNIEGGLLRAATREEIKELQMQGIEVDDDNSRRPRTPNRLSPKNPPLLLAIGRSQHIAPVKQTPTSLTKREGSSITGGMPSPT
jgi:hypothetical protein